MRGYLSTLGQSLQLVSSFRTTSGSASDRSAIFGFTVVNLLANAINILFGAQHKNDPNQLRYLKEQVNTELAPLKRDGTILPTPEQTLLPAPQHQSVTDYLRKYSVTTSEFVLRTAGSLSLIAPVTGWGNAWRNLRGGMTVGETFRRARNSNPVTFAAGFFSLAGKAFILAAKEPNPYNPEPPSLWRRARETLMFRASSISEAIGAAWMAHDRFTRQTILVGGKPKPDYFGGYGNLAVLAGYVPRWVAPYGSHEVDMPELYAHVAKGLAALPDDKIPPMLDKISAELAEHFRDKQCDAAQIRKEIEQQMHKKPDTRIQGNATVTHEKALVAEPSAQAAPGL